MTSTATDPHSGRPSLPPPPLPSAQSLRCSVCVSTQSLKCCSRCRSVYYCCREHQELDWKRHRYHCHPMVRQIQPQQPPPPPPPLPPTQPSHQLSHHSMAAAIADDSNIMAATLAAQSSMSSSTASGQSNEAAVVVADLLMPPNASRSQHPVMNGVNNHHSLTTTITTAMPPPMPPPMTQSVVNGVVMDNNNQQLVDSAHHQDVIITKLNSYCESIVRDLNEFGFCVIDDFLANGADILSEVHTLYKCGLFRAGQVVNQNKALNAQLIRGDHIVWVDGTEQMCSHIGFLVQTLDSIVMRCNTMSGEGSPFAKYRINRRTKAMIACYPGNNSQYVRHIDNPNNDGRCVTSIYYLNKDYNRQRDGGVLRLFPQISSCVADIEPKFNRVIFFWSDRRNPHEVMPSSRMRFAITVWYFDANERERAIQRYKQESRQYPVDNDLRPF